MEKNKTVTTDFILLGLWPEFSHLVILICLILLVYLMAVMGNAVLILLIWLDSRLHCPMYFLLSQLSLIDVALISTTVPKMATNFFSGKRTISQIGCGAQILFSLTLGISECLLLTLMSYDRYIAICNPLRYSVMMSHTICKQMVIGSWVGGAITSLVHTVYVMHLPVLSLLFEIMKNGNTTSYFILLGLFNHTEAQLFLFVMVLTTAFASLVGNALMILLIHQDARLHTPMYFLLSQLSLMDIMLVSTIVPKMAADYLTGKKSISLAGCGLQIFFFLTLGGGECFLLAAMSYDRYVAVCHPLRYPILMNWQLCLRMTVGSWFLGAADGLMQAATTLSFPFCDAHEINHFFCEAPSLLPLACADTFVFEYVMYVCCVLMLLVPFSFILISYTLILAAVLQMRSREVCKKAFATCSSHLS
ncbi:OR2T8 protein, partial [Crocuta crocuta]